MDPASPRRYTDEEVRLLLKRAAELESQGSALPAPSEGTTLSDLEAIASEAGIDPTWIRQAAGELGRARGSRPPATTIGNTRFFGAPLTIELERIVRGEASTSVLERLLPALQRAADGVGQPSLLGRTLTWQSADSQKTRMLHVSVTVARGETRVLVEERYGNLAGALFGGIMGGVGGGVGLGVGLGVGIGALASALFATVFPVAVIGGAYTLARTIYATTVRQRSRILNRLIEDLAGTLEDGIQDEAEGAGESET